MTPRRAKSDAALAKRLAALEGRGIDLLNVGSLTFQELAAVIGDVTFDEFDRMRAVAREVASCAALDAYSRAAKDRRASGEKGKANREGVK